MCRWTGFLRLFLLRDLLRLMLREELLYVTPKRYPIEHTDDLQDKSRYLSQRN